MIHQLKMSGLFLFTLMSLVACLNDPADDPEPSNPDITDPTSSISETSSSLQLSSSELSSSSEATGPICSRRATDLEFKFTTGEDIALGWQAGTYSTGNLTEGTLVVTEGDPCEEAQPLAAAMVGDDWNLFFQDPWLGRSGEVIKLDVITWSGEPQPDPSSSVEVSSSSVVVEDAVAGWFTEDLYNQAFPYRDPFYTWTSFVEAFDDLQKINTQGDFKSFLKEGTLLQRQREAAAFFANIVQETGTRDWNSGLFHIVETCAATGTPEGRCTGYGSSAGRYYYGRGPMQLSWNYNYEALSTAIYNNSTELLYDPDRVAKDPKIAWLAAMWFWNRVDTSYLSSPPPTIHDIMINGATFGGYGGFGGTIKIINGGIECTAPGNPKATSRTYHYKQMQNLFGIAIDESNLNCA